MPQKYLSLTKVFEPNYIFNPIFDEMFRFKPVDLSRKKIKKNTISKRKALKWAKAQCIFD